MTDMDATPPMRTGLAVPGWRRERGRPALAEVFGSIATRPTGSFGKKLLAFLGPGYLVAVGYMDPGNWATALAGGSKFGYALLTVALLSNLMAILLQALCARLGIGAGRDLAQACRDAFPRWVSWPLRRIRNPSHARLAKARDSAAAQSSGCSPAPICWRAVAGASSS